MKNSVRLMAAVALTAALLVAVAPTPAATSRQLFVPEGTSLAGTKIDPGFYKLGWKRNGSAESYIVTLRREGKIVAQAEARVELRGEKQATGGVTYRSDGNGGQRIAEIRFAGKREVIVIPG